jgi:hypothetical protein
MTNRNKDRIVAPEQPSNTNSSEHNGLFDFVRPTHYVELPSKGKFYNKEHKLFEKETIEIKLMTAKDEDTLSSQSLLKEGVAVDKFLENIIIDKQIRPEDLVIADKNAIIIESRIMAYGNLYETRITCPNCGTKQSFEFDLNNKLVHNGSIHENLVFNDKGNLLLELPTSKVSLEIKILTGFEEKQFIKKFSNEEETTRISDQYKMMIQSANGITDRDLVEKFIDLMPVGDSKFLRKIYNEVAPSLKIYDEFVCHSCNHKQELEVPFGADFLWPKS